MDYSHIKWRQCCLIGVAFSTFLLCHVSTRLQIRWRNSSDSMNIAGILSSPGEETKENASPLTASFGKSQPVCRIPKLKPFDPTIKHLVIDPDSEDCTIEYPLLFESTKDFDLVPVGFTDKQTLGFSSCCYRRIERGYDDGEKDDIHQDNQYSFSDECPDLSLTYTNEMNPVEDEFVVVFCDKDENAKNNSVTVDRDSHFIVTSPTKNDVDTNKIVDMHAFVPMKAYVENRVNEYYSKISDNGNRSPLRESDRLNVVILGIDATSHMNFIRILPKTYRYLKKLSAVEYYAFNKLGDNSLPNLGPLLTYKSKKELKETCLKEQAFDSCPFIWNSFAKQGFRTSFAEDSPWIGTFNYVKKGFVDPPTDYYLRPFAYAAEEIIATHEKTNAKLCYGPRFAFQILLDYMTKFAYAMEHTRRYFQFIWSNSLTHDHLNLGKLGDRYLRSTLKWLNNGGYLNESVLILMSDHGLRWGKIQKYTQGHYEGSLPFLFFIFPKWFRGKYSKAFMNLKENKNLLSTAYDLHMTLQDLLDLRKITNEKISKREMLVANFKKQSRIPRGISLFLPLPQWRTCEMSGIEDNFCVCHSFEAVPRNSSIIQLAANFLVYEINRRISKYSKCAFLTLNEILYAAGQIKSGYEDHERRSGRSFQAYQITIRTTPGDAVFQAVLLNGKRFKVAGTISRLTRYGNQSRCINNRELKLFCYCKDYLSSEQKSESFHE